LAAAQPTPPKSPKPVLTASKATELKVGMTTFLSGPAAVFGVPAKQAAELFVEELNAAGGINGVRISLEFLDEAQGTEALVQAYRKTVTEGGAKVMLASISSANCQALAPVAEELRVLNVMWDCGTDKVLESATLQYVIRSTGYATPEMVATALHIVRSYPNARRVAVVNQDYAWGRESWATLKRALQRLSPGMEVVGEFFPKFGATDFSKEIAQLKSLNPDIIVSTAWGGDLDNLVRQAAGSGLMQQSRWALPLGESSLERLGKTMPSGVIVGMRGDHYFLHPEYLGDFRHKEFVTRYRARTGAYPIYPVYHAVQGLQAVVAAYKESMKKHGGQWPTTEQVAATMHSLLFRGLTRAVRMRTDGQGMQEQMLGFTEQSTELNFARIGRLTIYPADLVTPPVGQKTSQWLDSLSPEKLHYSGIKVH
jgi:branched-chain amino acid transport system substrate-binding protein